MKHNIRLLLFSLTGLFITSQAQAAILEFQQPISGVPNSLPAYVYACDCTAEEFDSLTTPEGYTRSVRAINTFSSGVSNTIVPEGVAASFDVEGHTFHYLATALSGTPIGFGADGVQAIAMVQRSTVFTYDAGTVVHELEDTDGNTYILFAAYLDMLESSGISLDTLNALVDYDAPDGWVYSSRVLAEDLIIDSGGLATVYTTPGHTLWQQVAEVPVPAAFWLFGSAITLLAGKARKAKKQ